MKMLKIADNLEISKICLGGAQMLDMSLEEGKKLISFAKELGINIFDAHHRYGNCEKILGVFNDIIKMTKISVYSVGNRNNLFLNSRQNLHLIDIFWISDLDDISLYEIGVNLYIEYSKIFNLIGITTENPDLAYKFMKKFPNNKLFMAPLFIENRSMERFILDAKQEGKIVFVIKTLCAGQMLRKYSVVDCLEYIKSIDPSILVIGTSNAEHLKECIEIYER